VEMLNIGFLVSRTCFDLQRASIHHRFTFLTMLNDVPVYFKNQMKEFRSVNILENANLFTKKFRELKIKENWRWREKREKPQEKRRKWKLAKNFGLRIGKIPSSTNTIQKKLFVY